MVEVVQRHDQTNVLLADERCERWNVVWIRNPRDDRLAIGVVERRRERVGVGAENICTGSLEGADDVDALAHR